MGRRGEMAFIGPIKYFNKSKRLIGDSFFNAQEFTLFWKNFLRLIAIHRHSTHALSDYAIYPRSSRNQRHAGPLGRRLAVFNRHHLRYLRTRCLRTAGTV